MLKSPVKNASQLQKIGLFLLYRCLSLVFTISVIFFAIKASASDFCFLEQVASTCSFDSRSTVIITETAQLPNNPSEDLIVDNIQFGFRITDYDEENVNDALWHLKFQSIRYKSSSDTKYREIPGGTDYLFSMKEPQYRIWDKGHSIYGRDPSNKVIPSKVKLILKSDFIEDLDPDNYSIKIELEGKTNGDNSSKKQLEILINFKIVSQVKISGLKEINFGNFGSHISEIEEFVCVYSQGGAKFDIKASSDNGNGQFLLKGQKNVSNAGSLLYGVWFGSKSAAATQYPLVENVFLTNGMGMNGDTSENCVTTNTNMRLTVKLLSSFSEISALPADTYSDVLTVTVKAK